ncbi:hypothetical protein GCE9029_01343 [Grimontia celer]|uniref:SnoaL-like domain-containing protein n=1 Tax=Grimontia celer TaxID=1796497 RepID=A0A128EZ10_9GAMM|nr:hypothetical protein GCE9029_01343 [Grimontia celer]
MFSEIVLVDYTSAFGGEAVLVNCVDLMKQWAGLLSGFDATYHDLTNIKVDHDCDVATVAADITASHFIGEEGFWKISGRYAFELERSNDNWTIRSQTLFWR